MNYQTSNDKQLNRRDFIGLAATAVCGLSVIGGDAVIVGAEPPVALGMRSIPELSKVTIAKDGAWYQAFTGVAVTKDKRGEEVVVCSYLKTDQHLRTTTDIMVARSEDGGRTWKEHRSISHLDIESDGAIWVAPELNRLGDGRLVLICDKGQRKPGQALPPLTRWQTKEYGMSNHIFLSDDGGATWTGPMKTDDVGGEPERVHELSNGVWMYTRTDSRATTAIKRPVEPWGANYYRSTAVFSDDKGKTWTGAATVFDDQLYGDCEVGIVEYAPGKLAAFSHCGDAGSRYGQPSRVAYSSDFGKTWTKPQLAPFYGHRPIPGKLQSGKLLITFRNAWGTTGTYAFVFNPAERFAYQPNSFIWDEVRCQLKDGAMEIHSTEGTHGAVEFTLYPVEDEDSAVELEAELAVREADKEGCLIGAGVWVRFEPGRVSLAGRDGEGFSIDATRFHRYRLINRDRKLSIYVDGQLKLQTATEGIQTRYVHFGNRPGGRPPVGTIAAETEARRVTGGFETTDTKIIAPLRGVRYASNTSRSLWRSVFAKVMNRRDHSIDWRWTAKDGFPDQFRRDRFIRLDRNGTFAAGDSGYSGWTQRPDGSIVIVDYTTTDAGQWPPFVRAYLTSEKELAG
jgi:hypothetical protein